jgi:TolA-binding protein
LRARDARRACAAHPVAMARSVLAIVSVLLLSASTGSADTPRRGVPVAVELSSRVKPRASTAAAVARAPLTADRVLASEVLTSPVRAEQERILVELIARTPDADVADKTDLLFRLGELHAKQQRVFRLQSVDAELRGDPKTAAVAAGKAKHHLLGAVKAYKALTGNPSFHTFAKMDLALFLYAYTLQNARYLTEARAVYDQLLRNYPASKYVPEAHLAFAEHYFEANKLADAAARYKRVLEFPTASVYWYAMYKLGWIQLNQRKPQDALETFLRVVQGIANDTKQTLLHKHARLDFVRAYAEVGKTDKALVAFRRVSRDGALEMLERLAALYVAQGKSDRAIYTLRELMKTSSTSASVCDWQYEIAHATLSLSGATSSDRVREIEDLVRLYQAVGARLPAERARDCRDNAAAMAGELARAYHSEWAKTRSRDLLDAASRLYASYLGAFADADDFTRTRYFHAELLWSRAEQERDPRRRVVAWEQAADAFTAVVKGGNLERAILDDAAYAVVRAWIYARESDPRPVVEASPASDKIPVPRELPEREQKMLAAFDLYLTHTKAPPVDDLVRMKLLKANVLRRHDHLAVAVPLLREIVDRHSGHDAAEDAAMLLLDSLVRLADETALVAELDRLRARTAWLASRPALREHVNKLKRVWLRIAAERIERRARASRDHAALVRCGQAYVDIYNSDPDAKDNDEILYNAGVCFEDGRSIDAAIRMYQLLERFYPGSKLTARALVRLGKAYADIAFYDAAARTLERYAKNYGGEADSFQALSDAVFYAKGTGDDVRAIENTRYFVRTFGAKQPSAAANAAFSLASIYEKQGDREALMRHLRHYLRDHGDKGGSAKLVVAHARLAQMLLDQSCPVAESDGACVKIRRERAVVSRKRARGTKQCGPESAIEQTVVTRDPRLVREAVRHAALAINGHASVANGDPDAAIARHFLAQARLVEATLDYERYLAIQFPANLDFDPKQPAIARQSLARFESWLARKDTAARKAAQQLAAVLAVKDPASSVAAAARLGQVSHSFADALMTAEIPTNVRTGPYADDKIEAYCDVLTEHGEPLAARALEAYGTCLAKSTELGWFSEWSMLCERELGQLRPDAFPTAAERRSPADRVAAVTASEPPPAVD